MKKTLVIFIMLFLPVLCYASYSDSYREGYKQGYTYNPEGGIKGIPPIPPIAPIPNIGESSDNDAYTRGIIDGQNTKNNEY